MLQEILNEVVVAIDEAINAMAKVDYNSFILFIGRADVESRLKTPLGYECVIDYQLDRYYDETREAFYLRYLNRNYRKDGFAYTGDSGIDDLSIEMMIYTHLWDSTYFLKSIYRIASVLSGNGYAWDPSIPIRGKYNFIQNQVIKPLISGGYKIGVVLQKGYKSSIRNAFAHALYSVDVDKREIQLRPTSSPWEMLSFEEFQRFFLYSSLLMNKLQNCLEINHDAAAKINGALTEAFYIPDGIKVQVIAEMNQVGDIINPHYKLVNVID